MNFFNEIEKLYRGWGDSTAHPNSPSGGGGAGGFSQSYPLCSGDSSLSRLPHPHSPVSKELIHQNLTKALNNRFEGLKLNKLANHVPAEVIKQIPDCVTKFNINTPLRLAHFLAQCSHESAGFKVTQENLHYSAGGLKKTFPKYFPGNLAESYAHQPEKIAARVYARKDLGNGDEASKDGYKYRGRGYIQLTGKANYAKFDKTVDDDILNNPDLVSEKYPLLSAGWFWRFKSLNTLADKGSSDAVVTSITKKVNGGAIGLTDRIKHFKQFYALLI